MSQSNKIPLCPFPKAALRGGVVFGVTPTRTSQRDLSRRHASFFSCHVTVKKARLDLKMYQWFLISYDAAKERRRKCLLDYF